MPQCCLLTRSYVLPRQPRTFNDTIFRGLEDREPWSLAAFGDLEPRRPIGIHKADIRFDNRAYLQASVTLPEDHPR